MLSIPRSVRIYIASAPTDMRRSIDGLMALVTDELKEDAYSGHLFVFLSRRADRVKILTWDNGGFVLYYKRLEQGRFRPLQVDASATAVELSPTQLMMLLDGIDLNPGPEPEALEAPGGVSHGQPISDVIQRWRWAAAIIGASGGTRPRASPRSSAMRTPHSLR